MQQIWHEGFMLLPIDEESSFFKNGWDSIPLTVQGCCSSLFFISFFACEASDSSLSKTYLSLPCRPEKLISLFESSLRIIDVTQEFSRLTFMIPPAISSSTVHACCWVSADNGVFTERPELFLSRARLFLLSGLGQELNELKDRLSFNSRSPPPSRALLSCVVKLVKINLSKALVTFSIMCLTYLPFLWKQYQQFPPSFRHHYGHKKMWALHPLQSSFPKLFAMKVR